MSQCANECIFFLSCYNMPPS